MSANAFSSHTKHKHDSKVFAFFLLLMNVVASASVSIYIPCMKIMAIDFNTTNAMLQMSIVMNLIGEFLGRFCSGPLFDTYSNKKIVIYALSISILGHLGCSLSNSIEFFLCMRFFQALGSSVIYIVSIGIINSDFNENDKSSIIGILELYQPVAWIISPFVGGILAEIGSWRWSFSTLMILQIIGLFVFLEYREKTSEKNVHRFTIKRFFNDYKIVLRNTYFLIYALIPGMFAGGYMIFASNAPFISSKIFAESSLDIAMFQAIPLLFYILGTFIYRAIVRDFGIRPAKWLGTSIYIVFGIYITLLLAEHTPWTANHLLALMCVQCMGSSFLVPVSVLKAIQSTGHTSYVGAATVVVFRNLIMSLCITASTRLSESITMIMGSVFMTVATALMLITTRRIMKIRKRRI
ncbi:MAG: MFS transporter [Alphaproteobacteria bacterium]|nr:MFS transporter [Alphaproteobacteria bacterium]